ncbi:MAG: hypothetical protein DRP25_07620 [Thermotoga sp.]|nr:MAG: hypothetical protein DRP25_07620 [Thermotoga sp.]
MEEISLEYRRNCGSDETHERIDLEEEMDVESVGVEIDTDDTIVSAVDGVLTMVDEEEVRMLFFYARPLCNHDRKPIRYKGVAEFRLTPTAFKNILNQLNEAAKSLKQVSAGKEESNRYKPMFA